MLDVREARVELALHLMVSLHHPELSTRHPLARDR